MPNHILYLLACYLCLGRVPVLQQFVTVLEQLSSHCSIKCIHSIS